VADDGESRQAERGHRVRKHPSHRSLAERLAADLVGDPRITVTREVRSNYREPRREVGGDVAPRQVSFRIAVEQQHRRSTAGPANEYARTIYLDVRAGECGQCGHRRSRTFVDCAVEWRPTFRLCVDDPARTTEGTELRKDFFKEFENSVDLCFFAVPSWLRCALAAAW
jgi:hypothetical protein